MKSLIDNFKDGAANDTIIKIVGVGGGGGNAVANMYNEGIAGVSYLAINTDKAALSHMPFSHRLVLGDGLGAGNDPSIAEAAALASKEKISECLNDGTQMIFLTAGMGGGTGTGASPVVAKVARELGILTVGIVTLPFAFEMPAKLRAALKGISELNNNVDALIVVNNEKLTTFKDCTTMSRAFKEADNVLMNAAKSIADLVNIDGYVQVDFHDVKKCLTDGHKTVISTGLATGKNRVYDAIHDALNSNLVSTDNIMDSRKVILNFYCSDKFEITVSEINEVTKFMNEMTQRDNIWVKPGFTYDNTLGEEVRVTILAAGSGKICPEEYKAEYEAIEDAKRAAKLKEDPGKPANRYNLNALNESDDLLRTMRNEKAVTRIPQSDEEPDNTQSDEQ